jgi:hypothetical protein
MHIKRSPDEPATLLAYVAIELYMSGALHYVRVVVADAEENDGLDMTADEELMNAPVDEYLDYRAIAQSMTIIWRIPTSESFAIFLLDDEDAFNELNDDMISILKTGMTVEEALAESMASAAISRRNSQQTSIQTPKKTTSSPPTTGSPKARPKSPYKNSEAADMYNSTKTFVVNGPSIDLYEKVSGGPEWRLTLAELTTKNGARLTPKNILLYQKGQNMLCLDEKAGTVCNIDLNAEKIVDEWAAAKDVKVRGVAPLDKFAPRTGEREFTVITDQAIVSMDPRVGGYDKAVNLKACTYKSKTDFTAFATSKMGRLVVGGADGVVRTFDGTPGRERIDRDGIYPKRASTLVEGRGKRIKAVDISADSKWILTTSDREIVLYADDGNMFDRVFFTPKHTPNPIVLTLTDADWHRAGDTSFNAARFNTGPRGETRIVSSAGKLLVRWDLDSIKKYGARAGYKAKLKLSRIIDTQFVAIKDTDLVTKEAPVIYLTEDRLRIDEESATKNK